MMFFTFWISQFN